MFRFLRVKLQIQFSLIDAMLMGLKLSPSSTNKYITGTLGKGKGMGKGKGKGKGEGKGRAGKGRAEQGREGQGREGKGREGKGRERESERESERERERGRGWTKGGKGEGLKWIKGKGLRVVEKEGRVKCGKGEG